MLAYSVDLRERAIHCPERGVARTVGSPAAELVPEDHRPIVGEILKRRQVIVREAWPAMYDEQRRQITLPDDLVPDRSARDVDGPFASRQLLSHLFFSPCSAFRLAPGGACPRRLARQGQPAILDTLKFCPPQRARLASMGARSWRPPRR